LKFQKILLRQRLGNYIGWLGEGRLIYLKLEKFIRFRNKEKLYGSLKIRKTQPMKKDGGVYQYEATLLGLQKLAANGYASEWS